MAEVAIVRIPSGSDEIRAQYLRDFKLAAEDAGFEDVPVEPGTDNYWHAEAVAQICMIGITNEALHADDANVLTATGAALDRHREALGLPIVKASGSSGKIKVTIAGATSIPNGQQFKLPNGLRGQVVGTHLNPADGAEIDVTAIDTGALTNLKGGETVSFVSPPTNVATEATVSYSFPLTGGTDAENDERKRARILNTLRNKPAAGNWAYLRQLVLDNFPFVQDCYVYPALGGPSSQLIVPVREFDIENNDYSRAPSDALLQAIRNKIQSDANVGIETSVRAPTSTNAAFALQIEIPDSVLSGGNGQGWTDPTPWPQLHVSDGGRVLIDSVNSTYDELTIAANTTTSPVAGQTQIAWWSPADRKFYTALVTAVSGSAGAWVVTLDRPLVGIDGVGPDQQHFISPNAQNLQAYGDTWVKLFNDLGPGEATEDASRLPRAKRHPYATDEDPHSVTNATLKHFLNKHPEITDIEFSYALTYSPSVPEAVDDPVNVLIPLHFAVYPE